MWSPKKVSKGKENNELIRQLCNTRHEEDAGRRKCRENESEGCWCHRKRNELIKQLWKWVVVVVLCFICESFGAAFKWTFEQRRKIRRRQLSNRLLKRKYSKKVVEY